MTISNLPSKKINFQSISDKRYIFELLPVGKYVEKNEEQFPKEMCNMPLKVIDEYTEGRF